jgi:hypothetical protein
MKGLDHMFNETTVEQLHVGDRVRITDAFGHDLPVGTNATITSILGEMIYVVTDDGRKDGFFAHRCVPCDEVDIPDTPENPHGSIGDTVRCNWAGGHNMPINMTGTIIDFTGYNGWPYVAWIDKNGDTRKDCLRYEQYDVIDNPETIEENPDYQEVKLTFDEIYKK